MSVGSIVAIVIASLIFIYLLTIFILLPRKEYFSALFSKVYVSAFKLISMKMQKEKYDEIVKAYVLSKKFKLAIPLTELEKISTSGGNPLRVVDGLMAAKNAKLNFDLDFVKAVDISGRDILEVVRECINPKVVEIPLITQVAQDSREVNVKISLTLKTNISAFLTGVTEETISARAVEAVVTKIANTVSAPTLASRPELLDKAIYDAEIDAGAKYVLVSADVIHIDIGNDRGFINEKQRIEKEHIIATNKLEQRRLAALASEQEMKAKEQEKKLKILEEEAEVPKAIVEAIKTGKIKDVVDYYKLQNLQADTEMRKLMAKNYKSERNDRF
ncbi:MAG: hypothetical protein E7375_00850 [Clostridiales bacterium]|nr:hypothetical protein [Clostridiales bacterium]